jgi:hypothetical protein
MPGCKRDQSLPRTLREKGGFRCRESPHLSLLLSQQRARGALVTGLNTPRGKGLGGPREYPRRECRHERPRAPRRVEHRGPFAHEQSHPTIVRGLFFVPKLLKRHSSNLQPTKSAGQGRTSSRSPLHRARWRARHARQRSRAPACPPRPRPLLPRSRALIRPPPHRTHAWRRVSSCW